MKVTNIEQKPDKNNNPMKIATFENGDKVFVNSKYDALIYDQVEVGKEFELMKEGNFNKIKYDKPQSNFPNKIEKMMDKKADNIKEAQGRKNDAIAYFNSLNSAIAIFGQVKSLNPTLWEDGEQIKSFIVEYREWFLEEWYKYEAKDYIEKHNAF